MALLECQEVTKNFGGLMAIMNVSLLLEKGEIVGLIGANGAGKTTLFNLISGFYPPTNGSIRFEGDEIAGLKTHDICRKGLVRTFQIVRPFHNMTVWDNVMVGALFGVQKCKNVSRAKEEAMRVLEFTGLHEKKEFLAKGLTIADRKRLEVARSLATKPKLLLLDEVLAGLTSTETSEAMKLVKRIREEMGLTIFMVEHVMKAVMGLSDRIIVLHNGEKIAEGSGEQVSMNPAVIEAYLGEKLRM